MENLEFVLYPTGIKEITLLNTDNKKGKTNILLDLILCVKNKDIHLVFKRPTTHLFLMQN